MYLHTVIVLLRAEGPDKCTKMAWSQVHTTVEQGALTTRGADAGLRYVHRS
jgi:hypothetical protein